MYIILEVFAILELTLPTSTATQDLWVVASGAPKAGSGFDVELYP